jgi:hypothetical protein
MKLVVCDRLQEGARPDYSMKDMGDGILWYPVRASLKLFEDPKFMHGSSL